MVNNLFFSISFYTYIDINLSIKNESSNRRFFPKVNTFQNGNYKIPKWNALFIILAYKIKFIQLIICFLRENLQCLLVFRLYFLYLPPTKTIKNWSLVLSKLIWFLSLFKKWLSWPLLNFSVFMNQPFLLLVSN